ncbi:MAG: hypothetical protein JW797_11735 [Bradymonadales bacterium]|nr:hypothetical protein [Bradymonadales bacterium]
MSKIALSGVLFVPLLYLVTTGLVAGCGDDQSDGQGPGGNRSPQLDPVEPQEVDEGEELGIVFTVSDPDGDTLYLEAFDLPGDSSFNPVLGRLTYRPGYDVVSAEEGSLTLPDITVTVDDLYLSASTAVSITVHHVNRPPFFLGTDARPLTELEAAVDPDTEHRVRFQVIDPDDDQVSLYLQDNPAYARLEEDELVLAPTQGDNGSVDEFDIVASDGTADARLPVRVSVGSVEAEIPAPTNLAQSSALGEAVPVGGGAFEGQFTFTSDPHSFAHSPLRLQIAITEVGETFEDGRTGFGPAVAAGEPVSVEMTLEGGKSYRWRARFLSDEYGPGPYASFGGNGDGEADLVVSIVPETTLTQTPHNPSPMDVSFEFTSPNVTDFECQLDSASYATCSSPKTYFGLSDGQHAFRVRGVTRDDMPDPTPAEYLWQVIGGLARPDTNITAANVNNDECWAEFNFAAVLPPGENAGFFECCLEKLGPAGRTCSEDTDFSNCWPPKRYTDEGDGQYVFYVRAVNIVGERDETPASHAFTLDCN